MEKRYTDTSWCTPEQLAALQKLKEIWGESQIDVHGKEIWGDALLVKASYSTGEYMVIGIERDGYAHS